MRTARTGRLGALDTTGLLDSPAEEAFDRYTRLARRTLGAQAALITLVDADRQFFKSEAGLAEPWASSRQTPLPYSLCSHVVSSERYLAIADTRLDPLVADNPAIAEMQVGAYLGVPLTLSDGPTLGCFCAIDSTPRDWTAEDRSTLETLAAAVTAEIELRLAARRERLERGRVARSLERLAEHDPLTDLLNRRGLLARLSEIALAPVPQDRAGAVAVIDLDNFKYVNDTYGHAAGDELIVRCGEAIQSCVGPTTALARLGGDEFALIAPNSGEEEAMRLAGRLLECLRAVHVDAAGRRVGITGSVGVAMIPAESVLDPGDLLVAADLAMIEAKESGRDRARLAEQGSGALALARSHQTWVERIRDALSENRLELLAQPIALLDDGSVTRRELLLRMRGEDGELIVPASFLEIAERFDQIQAIDRWTVARAVELLAGPELKGALHVNLSGASITDPELVDFARAQISDAGVDGGRLTFEVTETAAIAQMVRAQQFASRLRDLGCTFALDDFGSGFGSFYYLKHLPFDFIKIDGEFIVDLATSLEDQLTVKSIATIVRALGKHSVAEYVRDPATAALLLEYGVDFGQGDHFGRPAPLL